jgi:hypothetical protein
LIGSFRQNLSCRQPYVSGRWGSNPRRQIVVEASDIVLVFTDEDGMRGILKGKVKLGATLPPLPGQSGGKPKSALTSFSDLRCLHTHGAKDCSREFHWTAR